MPSQPSTRAPHLVRSAAASTQRHSGLDATSAAQPRAAAASPCRHAVRSRACSARAGAEYRASTATARSTPRRYGGPCACSHRLLTASAASSTMPCNTRKHGWSGGIGEGAGEGGDLRGERGRGGGQRDRPGVDAEANIAASCAPRAPCVAVLPPRRAACRRGRRLAPRPRRRRCSASRARPRRPKTPRRPPRANGRSAAAAVRCHRFEAPPITTAMPTPSGAR